MDFYIMRALRTENSSNTINLQEFICDQKGDLTLQYVTQVYDVYRSTGNHSRYCRNVLSNVFNEMEFSKPLYCFTLPGLLLVAGGLHMTLNFLQAPYHGESLGLGLTILLLLLLAFFGIVMAFTGVLLHSIAGFIRYKKSNA